MSAPDTDTETLKKRHRHAIRGIKTAIIVGALMMIAAVIYAVLQVTDPTPESATAAEVSAGQGTSGTASDLPPDLQQ